MWRIAALVWIAGCYEPTLDNCTVTCETSSECARGLVCSAAGLCATELASCETLPADATPALPSPVGTYAILLTNHDNGCAFPSWTIGATSEVEADISINAGVVVAEPKGPVAAFLDAWLGNHIYAGTQTAAALALVLAGNKQATQGNCTFTFDAQLAATITGDTLAGEIEFLARTNGHSSCGALTGCVTRQAFNGTRAPQ